MQRSNVRGWICAILIVSAGSRESFLRRLVPAFVTAACGSKRVPRKGR